MSCYRAIRFANLVALTGNAWAPLGCYPAPGFPFMKNKRALFYCSSLLLSMQWCSTAPKQHAAVQLPPAAIVAAVPMAAAVPLAPLIRALLDSAANSGLLAERETRAFYGTSCEPAWTTPGDSLSPNTAEALAALARAPEHGLSPTYYGEARLLLLRDSLLLKSPPTGPARARQQARFDVGLTDAMLRYLRDLDRGRLHPYTASVREKAAGPAGQPAVGLRAALAGHGIAAAILAAEPANREYRQLQRALAAWLAQPVPPDSAAIHRAQYELAAINLERWRWEAVVPAAEYIWINIPAFELQVVERDSAHRPHRVVVGAPATPTPTLSGTIRYFTLAPDWHVPRSIATKEMLPRLQRDATYLARNNYALYNDRGQALNPAGINWAAVTAKSFAYTIRQSAGCENALGNIVFRFANPYSVYVHDTPLRQLFARPGRALSHGCIRLESPFRLAAYLLRREGRPVLLPSEAECARQARPHDVRLARPVPLYVRYATCTAENGRLRFFADVYHRDETVRRALFGPKALVQK